MAHTCRAEVVTRGPNQRLSSAFWTLFLGVGLPVGLVHFVGSPLPSHWPSHDELLRWLSQPVTRGSLTVAVIGLLWLGWAAFVVVVLAEVLARLTRVRLPRPGLPYPLHTVVTGLFGAAVVTVTAAPTAVAYSAATQAAAEQPVDPERPASLVTAQQHPDNADREAADPAHANVAAGPYRTSPSPDSALATNRTSATAVVDVTSTAGVRASSVLVRVGQRRPDAGAAPGRYVVRRGDTLSSIARAHLGDANRWPQLCALNWHRHWPKVGGTLRDCDLIYPGWDLKLPADAKPPTGATPATPPPPPPAQPEPDPDPGGTAQPTPVPSASTPASEDPDGVVEPSTTTPPATPSVSATARGAAPPPATTVPTPAATSPPAAWASATASPATTATASDDTTAAPSTDDGVNLPGGSFVPWALAAAITAAAAMVWLQRRRRFIPGDGGDEDDDPPELPPPVVELYRHVTRNPDVPIPGDLAERAVAVPALPLLPPGGIGLVGDGAHAAARAALISTLASGGPRDPDRRGEVVIDGTALTTLIGADAAALGPWPRLHVAGDLDHALSILDSRLLHRARILDEHSLTDLASLRERAPDEEALPPVLLICQTPPPGARMRARVSFGLGTGLDVSALLLGTWEHGSTIDVAADGHTRIVDGPPLDAIGERVAVLDTAEAVAILATLREAHTGEPPTLVPRPPPTPPRPAAPEPDASTDDGEPAEQLTAEPSDTPRGGPRSKVHLRVLGTPMVEDITLPGRSLRGKAAELAVYLACHPDGADTATIAEHLVPEVKLRPAKQQVHTNASNLRHVLGRAGGPLPGGYVLKRGATARYRLDPTTVDVDLWRLRHLLTRAQLASAPARTEMLREACETYTAPLAAGCDYEWVDPHREQVRQWGTEAHLLLAEDLLTTDPQAASDLLDKAIGLDRYNEGLYRTAMHARHALGDADGIRALLRAITKALSDLDVEPDEATVDLAAELRTSLERR